MSTVAHATGKFADRIVELLDIFDLSFFVSGAAALGAVLTTCELYGVSVPGFSRLFSASPELPVEILLVGIVASYALGLGCFALGRVVRPRLQGQPNAALMRLATEHHPLDEVLDLKDALEGDRGNDARLQSLYNRLWVHVRTLPELASTFSLVKRYWVLAATFDGMGIALLGWLVPVLVPLVIATPGASVGAVPALLLAIALVGSAYFCWRQSAEYRKYQVDELVATVVHWKALREAEALPNDD